MARFGVWSRRLPASGMGRAAGLAAALTVLVAVGAIGGAGGQTIRPSTPLVLAIQQSNYTTEQESFTVSMQLSSTANVQFVFFTFCQLSSPLCYLPVSMAAKPGNWYVGTTNPMTSYNGMTVGVRAGYNITIDYSTGNNVTEPSIPNAFSNLTIAQSVTGEYMFQMTVNPQLYGLSGVVDDAATGAAIAGATVSVSPSTYQPITTSATGAYAFPGLANGSYTLSVTDKGYLTATQTVAVSGQAAVKDLTISNSSTPQNQNLGGNSGGSHSAAGFWSGAGLWLAVVAGVVIVGLAAVFLMRRRGGGISPSPPAEASRAPDPKSE